MRRMHQLLMDKAGRPPASRKAICGKEGGQEEQRNTPEHIARAEHTARRLLSSQPHLRQRALEKIKENKRALVFVAVNSPYEDTRMQAVGMIKDDKLLAEVANESRSPMIRELAVEKMETQEALKGILADTRVSLDARMAAAGRVKDERALAESGALIGNSRLGLFAVSRILDMDILRRISLYSPCKEVRVAAGIKAIALVGEPEQAVLKEIVLETQEIEVGMSAVYQMTDAQLLADIALSNEVISHGGEPVLQLEAVEKMYCMRSLERVLRNTGDMYVREDAAAQIAGMPKGSTFLKKLVRDSGTDAEWVFSAIRQLHDIEVLAELKGDKRTAECILPAIEKRIGELGEVEAIYAEVIGK